MLTTSSLQVYLKHRFVYMSTSENVGCFLADWSKIKNKAWLDRKRKAREGAQGKGRTFLSTHTWNKSNFISYTECFTCPLHYFFSYFYCIDSEARLAIHLGDKQLCVYVQKIASNSNRNCCWGGRCLLPQQVARQSQLQEHSPTPQIPGHTPSSAFAHTFTQV